MLKKVAKENREKERKKGKETYCAGSRIRFLSRFNERQQRVLDNGDFVKAIGEGLRDYCELTEEAKEGGRRVYGGRIPDRVYRGSVQADEGVIDITLTQAYSQPPRLVYAEAEMRYNPKISEEDLNAVRRILTDAGLERRV